MLEQWLECLELLIQQLVGLGLLHQLGLGTLAEGLNLDAELLDGLALRLQSLMDRELGLDQLGLGQDELVEGLLRLGRHPGEGLELREGLEDGLKVLGQTGCGRVMEGCWRDGDGRGWWVGDGGMVMGG